MSFFSVKDNFRDCLFCYDNIQSKIIEEFNSVVALKDTSPVTHGHLLIIPKRHCIDFFHMTLAEQMDANNFLAILSKKLIKQDPLITGFNIGVNNGESAGQTIYHCHIHLIPRRDCDTPEPRGGVRGVIPDKMNY
jgi:ATP adenylyltransferase